MGGKFFVAVFVVAYFLLLFVFFQLLPEVDSLGSMSVAVSPSGIFFQMLGIGVVRFVVGLCQMCLAHVS